MEISRRRNLFIILFCNFSMGDPQVTQKRIILSSKRTERKIKFNMEIEKP